MRGALPLALLTALVFAGRAVAAPAPPPTPPIVEHPAIGGTSPIRVGVTVGPPVETFGDTLTAVVSVFADTRWVDPANVRPLVNFAPYQRVGTAVEHETRHGRILAMTWTWTLRCLTVECLPDGPRASDHRVFRLRPIVVDVLDAHGKVAYGLSAALPGIKVYSNISPKIVTAIKDHRGVAWQYETTPIAPQYRVSPGLIFWLALVLGGLIGTAGLALLVRWVLRFRTPYVAAAPAGPASSSLERALALFFWAGGRGDETLQRKALERVAAELPFDVADLSEVAREIAWSPEMPEEDEVKVISEKAGVLTHSSLGTDG